MAGAIIGPPGIEKIDSASRFLKGASEFSKKVEKARTFLRPYSVAVRKRAYAADLANTLDDEIRSSLAKNGRSYDEFLALGRSRLTAFFTDIPCLDVEIEIGSQRNGFWNRSVDPNDLIDLSFLSVAIPYCDFVVTEKFWVDLAIRANLHNKYKTVLTCPHYLVRFLS